jgi:hypothetical protein
MLSLAITQTICQVILRTTSAMLVEAHATKQGLRRDALRKIARGVLDVDT